MASGLWPKKPFIHVYHFKEIIAFQLLKKKGKTRLILDFVIDVFT